MTRPPPLSQLAWSMLMRFPWPPTCSPASNYERGYQAALSTRPAPRKERRVIELEIALRQLLNATHDQNPTALALTQAHAATVLAEPTTQSDPARD